MAEDDTPMQAPVLGRFVHRIAQPLARARLAAETAALRLQAGDPTGATERLLLVDQALDDLLAPASRRACGAACGSRCPRRGHPPRRAARTPRG